MNHWKKWAETILDDLVLKRREPAWLAQERRRYWMELSSRPDPEADTLRIWCDALMNSVRVEVVNLPNSPVNRNPKIISTVADADALFQSFIKDYVTQGLIYLPWPIALEKFPDLIQQTWGIAEKNYQTMSWESLFLNCFWTGGRFVYVPDRMQVEVPLQEIITSGVTDSSNLLVCHHLWVGNESSVDFLTGCLSGSLGNGLRAQMTSLKLGKKARAGVTRMFKGHSQGCIYAESHVVIGCQASLSWSEGGRGGKVTYHNHKIKIEENEGSAEWTGIYSLSPHSHNEVDVDITKTKEGGSPNIKITGRLCGAPAAKFIYSPRGEARNGPKKSDWKVMAKPDGRRFIFPPSIQPTFCEKGASTGPSESIDPEIRSCLGEALHAFPMEYQIDLLEIWNEDAALA